MPHPLQKNVRPVSTKRPRARKNISWLSLLPFVSSISAKRVRQSVLLIVGDLVVLPFRTSNEEQRNAHEILASVVETCAEHNVSLSTVLQEAFIADHTPMYWAIVNYRQELLVALLVHSRPLSIQSVSDIRRACLVTSNQALFHALRTCRYPFHGTDGIQAPSLRTGMFHPLANFLRNSANMLVASDNLLLGNRPMDESAYNRRAIKPLSFPSISIFGKDG
ncbi:hypothetical protein JVT61DRAFT_852 [Boletus reticuloceps]|uniref:Uncharacterized protein n=1 Tax=Boletus reticuloceps TaxID=495285 RepID=A0A8I3AE18_9AGAM|nr:hypothetical protein JVT61DRAFT_852 [Boletus reticuloceps]